MLHALQKYPERYVISPVSMSKIYFYPYPNSIAEVTVVDMNVWMTSIVTRMNAHFCRCHYSWNIKNFSITNIKKYFLQHKPLTLTISCENLFISHMNKGKDN